jgi:hypothetical protein
MSVRKELLIEALVVGVSTTVVGAALAKAGLSTARPLFWFTLGVVTHVGWEIVGGNRWYVETRKAEDFPKGLIG